MKTYVEYYHRTIQQHKHGFKLVLGGTGLGKTSAIKDVIQEPEYQESKFIYCANRKQLIDEMAQALDSACRVILYRDLEVVQNTLNNYRTELYDLLENPLFLDNLRRWNDKSKLKRIDLPTVRRACKLLEDVSSQGMIIPKILEDQMEDQARLVLRAFRSVLLGANNKKGNSPSYQKLADHPVVQSLFPYIAFKRRPEVRILLVTLQKAFHGFFNGQRTLNLTTLQDDDGNYTIFLDEFDFLENDLVGLICHAPQINHPFRFVELFYSAMERHKLPLETYPLSSDIRERIQVITTSIGLLQDTGIPFPNINQFTYSFSQSNTTASPREDKHTKRFPAIFRTRHIINTSPLYMRLTNRSFELIIEPNTSEKTHSALRLFDIVSRTSERILLLFKELEKFDEIIHREMLRHCYQDTSFPEQMALVAQFAHPTHEQNTQMGTLLDSGYSLYDIDDLQQRTDRDEVEVRHYGMYLTPEMILRNLANNNLVFGLSATADIKRHVHNFNLNWLSQQINLIEIDETDRAIIQSRNEQKAAARKTEIQLVTLEDLDHGDDYQRQLDYFLTAVATDEDFGPDSTGHLKRRVQQFFAALLWMCTNSQDEHTHLLFLNTFRQIKLVFDRYQKQDERLFAITKRNHNSWFDVYEIMLHNRTFIVVFYNAQFGTQVRQNESAKKSFDSLFWEGKPVIVITQYLSAGNGVNLQYCPKQESEEQQDFTHIGLLETPYFYFSKPDPDQTWDDRIAALKENIWYQAKLFAGKAIPERRFRQVLSSLNASSEWNNRYQKDPSTAADALFNQMATFMQALGRVERIWTAMPKQTVLFSRDVYHRFQTFCLPIYDEIRLPREPMISTNLQHIFAQISTDLPLHEQAIEQFKDARLGARDARCIQAIQRLLKRLEGIRKGKIDSEAREHWIQLRQASLKHEFRHERLREYSCVTESIYYNKGVLYLTPQKEIIPARLAQPDTYLWHMDKAYDLIEQNRVIQDYFIEQGYELAFNHTSQQFFTPYFYQAILLGAIGEEAITALLLDEDIAFEEIPDLLFEVADLKILHYPWYIDCKYYNEVTMERFSSPSDDVDAISHPKLNDEHFRDSACSKVERLSSFHKTPAKLIYINLVSSQDRTLDYYDQTFQPVTSLTEASIIIIQGALQRAKPNAYQQAFEYFLQDLKALYGKGETL